MGGGYGAASGTSLSAPLVAGTAALIYSVYLGFSSAQVEQFIFSGASPLGTGANDATYGAGRLDVRASLALAKAVAPTPAPKVKGRR